MNSRCFSYRNILFLLVLFFGAQTAVQAVSFKQKTKNVKEEVKLLGFDPKYQGLPTDADKGNKVVIFLCGHNGLDKKPVKTLKNIENLNVVTFDFGNMNGKRKFSLPIPLVSPLNESIGGTYDVQPALFALTKSVEKKCSVVFASLSRGGAAAITLMHVIEFPDKYKKIWKKFGFTKPGLCMGTTLDYDRIKKLKDAIKKVYINNTFLYLGQVFPLLALPLKALGTIFAKMDWREPYSRLQDLPGKGWNVEFGRYTRESFCHPIIPKLCKKDKNWTFHDKNGNHLDYQRTVDSIRASS